MAMPGVVSLLPPPNGADCADRPAIEAPDEFESLARAVARRLAPAHHRHLSESGIPSKPIAAAAAFEGESADGRPKHAQDRSGD